MAERREAAREAADEETAQAITELRRGAPESLQQLIPQVYAELRRIAHRQLAAESPGHTLSTTAVVHEAYLRLSEQTRVDWSNRAQFFGLAARVMRRVLVDYARRHRATRRGGARRQGIPLEQADGEAGGDALSVDLRSDELLALDEALERLAAVDPRLSRVVEYRYFGGLTEAETAEVLGVSKRTVSNDWLMAKGWLYRELGPGRQ
ncbi:MAG TPA: ECF-type sigma factor [Gemmatimonadales bacterium]|nr:ECF-type sigma factor [Gemmatimonadales bacterium]